MEKLTGIIRIELKKRILGIELDSGQKGMTKLVWDQINERTTKFANP